jgi:hypothetical protein
MKVKLNARSEWIRISLVGLAMALPGVGQAPKSPPAGASGTPVLLELFTSEGCSSCPPADALLGELNGTIRSGHLIVALSEHVTYWNRLGWQDPFSSEVYTNRQNGYAERFHLDGGYTPQLVINGAAEVVGSDRQKVMKAIESQPWEASVEVHVVSSRRVANGLAVVYSISGRATGGDAELFAAVADDVGRSKVLRGENGGRTLSHVAVVRSLVRVGRLNEARADQEAMIPFPPSTFSAGGHQHLVLFVQGARLGPVLSVAARPLDQL